MKKIVIVMDRGVIDARYDDGTVLRQGEDTAFLGRLEINNKAHGDLMPSDQIRGFLVSVVLPQLDLFSRQLETEVIEEEEAALEIEAGPAP
jgi:hypothetical protein